MLIKKRDLKWRPEDVDMLSFCISGKKVGYFILTIIQEALFMRTAKQTSTAKKTYLKALEKSLGIVSTASEETGISRNAYYKWCKKTGGG